MFTYMCIHIQMNVNIYACFSVCVVLYINANKQFGRECERQRQREWKKTRDLRRQDTPHPWGGCWIAERGNKRKSERFRIRRDSPREFFSYPTQISIAPQNPFDSFSHSLFLLLASLYCTKRLHSRLFRISAGLCPLMWLDILRKKIAIEEGAKPACPYGKTLQTDFWEI